MELGIKLKKKITMIMSRGVIDTKHIPSFSGNIHRSFTLHGIYILLKVGCFVMVGLRAKLWMKGQHGIQFHEFCLMLYANTLRRAKINKTRLLQPKYVNNLLPALCVTTCDNHYVSVEVPNEHLLYKMMVLRFSNFDLQLHN
jgi:hypothetical protein